MTSESEELINAEYRYPASMMCMMGQHQSSDKTIHIIITQIVPHSKAKFKGNLTPT